MYVIREKENGKYVSNNAYATDIDYHLDVRNALHHADKETAITQCNRTNKMVGSERYEVVPLEIKILPTLSNSSTNISTNPNI